MANEIGDFHFAVSTKKVLIYGMMEQISKYIGSNKTAIVYKSETSGYVVEFYIDGRVLEKRNVGQLQSAENLAEDYVLKESGNNSQLLNENA